MFSMLSNVWNTTYLKWLFIFLFVVAILHMAYGWYAYFFKNEKNYLVNSVIFILIIIISCYCVGWGIEIEKTVKNTNIRYEFITEDGIKHEGSSCYMTGGLFSTDGVYCKDYDGFTHTNVISYNRIVEVPDEN